MDHPTKVTGRRTGAYVIDAVPAFVIFVLAVRTFGEQVPSLGLNDGASGNGLNASWSFGDTKYLAEGAAAAQVFGVCTLWLVANLVALQGLAGASIGKFVVGLRVVRPDGSPCGVGRALVRWLVLFVDAFPYFVPLVGFVLVLSSVGNRRLGDMAANTYVVRASAVGYPIVAPESVQASYRHAQALHPGYGPPTGPAAPPAPDAQWDAARGAWLRWDGVAWTQLDPATGRWSALR